MSGSNAPQGGLITLDELERLIRILGMLGSSSDGEVLNAARFADAWVRSKGTDWRTLLTPPEEALPVIGVAASPDQDALAQAAEADRVQAFQNGYQAGARDAAAKIGAQLKAQAAALNPAGQSGALGFNPWNMAQAGLGGGLGGLGVQQAVNPNQQAWAAQAASQGPQQAAPGVMRSWQDVARELLARTVQGIPGVFRNANEESFVADVLQRGFRTLTPAQDTWLRDIAWRNGLSW